MLFVFVYFLFTVLYYLYSYDYSNIHYRMCNLSFSKVKRFLAHYRLHRHVPIIRFPCYVVECNQAFSVYSTLLRHVLRYHKGVNVDQDNTFR